MMKTIKNYILLTKPAIMLLVLVTGAASLFVERSLLALPGYFILVMLGLLLTGGSANAFNMYFERDIDALMERTRVKRPLPAGNIKPIRALIFAVILGVAAIALFALFFNSLSALMSLGTIVYYSFFYTLYLKPRTPYNVVIGSAAGSMAPLIAWAAARGEIGLAPVILSAIIFFWSPAHFWSLALFLKKDYELTGQPMMPLVKGESVTRLQILLYSFWTVAVSIAFLFAGGRLFYLIVSISLGIYFIIRSVLLVNNSSEFGARNFFRFSIIYLFSLYSSVIVDSLI